MNWWRTLHSDDDAHWDKVVTLKGEEIAPVVTWGTSPEDVLPIDGAVPDPELFRRQGRGGAARARLHGPDAGAEAQRDRDRHRLHRLLHQWPDRGSARRRRVLKGKKIRDGLRAMIVPGSGLVRAQAEEEGLADIFREAGFEWRLAGCSMCLAMNPDQLAPGERCAATSNRNFEGRQGRGGRTHLMSPAMAAAAAVTGRLTDVREMMAAPPDTRDMSRCAVRPRGRARCSDSRARDARGMTATMRLRA